MRSRFGCKRPWSATTAKNEGGLPDAEGKPKLRRGRKKTKAFGFPFATSAKPLRILRPVVRTRRLKADYRTQKKNQSDAEDAKKTKAFGFPFAPSAKPSRLLRSAIRTRWLKTDYRTQKENQSYAEDAEKTKVFWVSFCALCETFAHSAAGSPHPPAQSGLPDAEEKPK